MAGANKTITGLFKKPWAAPPISLLNASEEYYARRKARESLLSFMAYVWWMAHPLQYGLHTQLITERIDRAIADFKNGISTFLLIALPFRHGKTDIISRALPPFFVGNCAEYEPDIILTGYGADLVHKFSRRARIIVASENYQKVFPDVQLAPDKSTDALWCVEYFKNGKWSASSGEVTTTGLGGAIVGSGYELGLVDDYCKNRMEAESETYRDRIWESFRDDFMTRRGPNSITIVTATPWHTDDLIGRIKKAMHEDEVFPKFEILSFPARGPALINGEKMAYESEFLFPQRYNDTWYKEHYATLGRYGSSGLLDCDPSVRGGNLFKVDKLKIQPLSEFPKIKYVRCWDPAYTEKQTTKDNPDYTAGALVGVIYDENKRPHIWLRDLVVGQWATPERNRKILETAERDGPEVSIGVEAAGGAEKDSYTLIADILRGKRIVERLKPSAQTGDIFVRASPMEPIFDGGNFHVIDNLSDFDLFFKQFSDFPGGTHDDIVAAVAAAYNWQRRKEEWGGLSLEPIAGGQTYVQKIFERMIG